MNIYDCSELKYLIPVVGGEITSRPRMQPTIVKPEVEAPPREGGNVDYGVITIQKVGQTQVAKVSSETVLHPQSAVKGEPQQKGEWLKPDPIKNNPYKTREKPQPFFVSLYA